MSVTGVRFEALTKDNYDTWKLQVRALLIKNDAWPYVSGTVTKPVIIEADPTTQEAANRWTDADLKAQSDIILAMSPPEIKQIKDCTTAREIWVKLENTYQSKGPARKAAFLNQLMSLKMENGDDVREHSQAFLDVVDKLAELEIAINKDLLAVMFLRSLPEEYENFRCAMSTRDELPSLETLRIKVTEESETRKISTRRSLQNAMVAAKSENKNRHNDQHGESKKDNSMVRKDAKMKCFKCGKVGHRARNCRSGKISANQTASVSEEDVCLFTKPEVLMDKSFKTEGGAVDLKWCFDSGCTSHMCGDLKSFIEINQENEHKKINLASSARADIFGKGVVSTKTTTGKCTKTLKLSDTLYVPDLRSNLISVSKITDKGNCVLFDRNSAKVVDENGKVVITGIREGGLYFLTNTEKQECRAIYDTEKPRNPKKNSLEDWHVRLGHLNIQSLREAIKKGSIQGVTVNNINENFKCSTCFLGKMCRPPFPKESKRKTCVGDIIHSDICGPMRVSSLGKKVYFATFIDDSSGWCEIRFLSRKSEVAEEFENFRLFVDTQKGIKIKTLQSDNGKEYDNRVLDQILLKNGIIRRLTAPYNPEQNGVSERRNRTLMETARCLLIESGLPSKFWAEAVNTANFVRNRSPSRRLEGKTPFEMWHGKPPNVSDFKRFGSQVFVMNRSPGIGKLEPRSREGVFLGYSSESKAYRVWIKSEEKIVISRDVKFTDNLANIPNPQAGNIFLKEELSELELKSPANVIEVDLRRNSIPEPIESDLEEEDEVENENEDDDYDSEYTDAEEFLGFPSANPPATRRGRPRILRTGLRGRPRKVKLTANLADQSTTDSAFLTEIPVERALAGPDSLEWKIAMAEEVKSIIDNKTWNLTKRTSETKAIGSRFILRDKIDPEKGNTKRKARIVAKGFLQQPGKDFHETYAPVARLSSIRTAIALAARNRMNIRQYDVTTAYLNGKLDEEVFMEIPRWFEDVLTFIINERIGDGEWISKVQEILSELQSGDTVCHMRKAIYGLKQAARVWHNLLDRELRNLGAHPTKSDPCVYLKNKGEKLMIIVIYVDDLLIMCKDHNEILNFGRGLSKVFDMKDVGDVKRCLGMDFVINQKGIFINHETYIASVLTRFGMIDCNQVSTPLDPGTHLTKDKVWEESDGEKPPYRELVGCLLYLSISTRPDLSHAACILSQFNDCFGKIHWNAAKRVLRYLKGTMKSGILYEYDNNELAGYVDADWGSSIHDRRSCTGYVFLLSGGAIVWDSRKQRTVALSTTEAEYMAMADAAKEIVHLRRFLLELETSEAKSIKLYVDNMSAQKLAVNPVHHSRTKHIDVRHHFIREVVKSGQVELEHVESGKMLADVLTKFLPKPRHEQCILSMGLINNEKCQLSS